MFLTGNRIYHSTEYIRSVWITCRDGLFFCRQLKNLQTSLPAVAQLVFFSRRRTALLLPSRRGVIERTYFILRNRRIEVKKKYRLMTQDNRHNRKSSFTPSPAHTALRRTARVMAVIIGAVVGLVLMVILKPICRGVGWVISLISAVVIIFWLITNF